MTILTNKARIRGSDPQIPATDRAGQISLAGPPQRGGEAKQDSADAEQLRGIGDTVVGMSRRAIIAAKGNRRKSGGSRNRSERTIVGARRERRGFE